MKAKTTFVKFIGSLSVSLGLWCFSGAAHADGFCGPGAYDPNNGNAPAIVCVPIAGGQQAPQQKSPPVEDVDHAASLERWREAKKSSLAKEKALRKELNLTDDDKCLTYVEGNTKQTYMGYGRTKKEAEQKQMARCEANGDTNCHVNYTSFDCH